MKRQGRDGRPQWAYRYRTGGRDSQRIQRGGFASEQDAIDALGRELNRVRREQRIPRSLTFADLVDVYLAQHDVQPVTIEKLRWLLSKATAVFGERRIGELTSQEIAEWRMKLSSGYRFEATQAVRQVLNRAVVWGMLDINPAKVGVDNPIPRRKEHPFDTWAELEALAAALGRRYGPMILFAAATGLRPAEWVALEKRDVDRDERVVYVAAPTPAASSSGRRPKAASARCRCKRARSRRSTGYPRTSHRSSSPASGAAISISPLPPVPVATSSEGCWHLAATADLRSPPHLRHLRPPCRHLHLRPLPLHGRQPHHDRPPLRPSRPRRTRAIKLLDALNAADFEPWTLVDAAWTPKHQSSVSADNRKAD